MTYKTGYTGFAVGSHLPASFIGEAIAHGAHVVAYRTPFRTANDADVLDGKNCKEQILICSIIPIPVVQHGV